MRKVRRPADVLAEMIRDGLAEEGFEVQVHPDTRIGWDVAIISDGANEGTQSRADAIAAGLRRLYDLEA
jgi:hypothetical protein